MAPEGGIHTVIRRDIYYLLVTAGSSQEELTIDIMVIVTYLY
jgi:hypothetical protein